MPTSSSEPTRPWSSAQPRVGSVIRERILSSVLLPAPLRPDEADDLALVDLEGDAAERPDRAPLG